LEWVFQISPRSKKHRGAASTTTTTPALLLFFFTSKRAVTMEAHAKDTERIERIMQQSLRRKRGRRRVS
jgi:hypothetical protein